MRAEDGGEDLEESIGCFHRSSDATPKSRTAAAQKAASLLASALHVKFYEDMEILNALLA
jgi:hypothetical protein